MELRSSQRCGVVVLVVVFLLPLGQGQAQPTLGAREVALGQATSALPKSAWAIFSNPALLEPEGNTLSFFGLRYYGLPELTDLGAVLSIPTPLGIVAFGAHRYGDDLFNESRFRLAYGGSYERFNYGLTGTYYHIVMGGEYGSVAAIGLDVGMAAEITESFWIGAVATNVNQPVYGEVESYAEEMSRSLSIGFSYRLEERGLISADVIKDVRFPLSYRSGLEVFIVKHFAGRVGITVEPVTYSGGFGYRGEFLEISVAVQKHENPVLGWSPGCDLTLSW